MQSPQWVTTKLAPALIVAFPILDWAKGHLHSRQGPLPLNHCPTFSQGNSRKGYIPTLGDSRQGIYS